MSNAPDKPIIVDACVWVDILVGTRPRHARACEFYEKLRARGYTPVAPMHLHFEILSALRHEREKPDAKKNMFASAVRGTNSLGDIYLKPVDLAFVNRYSKVDLPRLRGDSVYLAMAITDGLEFVTADDRCLKIAKRYGVRAYTVDEFIARLDS